MFIARIAKGCDTGDIFVLERAACAAVWRRNVLPFVVVEVPIRTDVCCRCGHTHSRWRILLHNVALVFDSVAMPRARPVIAAYFLFFDVFPLRLMALVSSAMDSP